MQSLSYKVALLSILLALCVNSQGLPFYFDPMGKLGGTTVDPNTLTFTFTGARPATITLGESYAGPATPALALFDAGDGWFAYTGKTITVKSNVVKFKGDWRNSSGGYRSLFSSTFGSGYPCYFTGTLPGMGGGYPVAPATSMFLYTFQSCTGLTGSIPSGLFGAISGAPALSMFHATFQSCTGLTGSIPSGLFGAISGAPAISMFRSTFQSCTGLTGSIPSSLFGAISGAPAPSMFHATFYTCSSMTGSIPSGLFGAISGAPAPSMFHATFYTCSSMTGSIPSGLFGAISGAPALSMFHATFQSCTGLTGQSALMPDGVTHLYEAFPTATATHVGLCYRSATGLTDYVAIPTDWK